MATVNWEGLDRFTIFFRQWWMELGNVGDGNCLKDRVELTAYIFWHLLKARNAWLFNKLACDPKRIADIAVQEWGEFKEAAE